MSIVKVSYPLKQGLKLSDEAEEGKLSLSKLK